MKYIFRQILSIEFQFWEPLIRGAQHWGNFDCLILMYLRNTVVHNEMLPYPASNRWARNAVISILSQIHPLCSAPGVSNWIDSFTNWQSSFGKYELNASPVLSPLACVRECQVPGCVRAHYGVRFHSAPAGLRKCLNYKYPRIIESQYEPTQCTDGPSLF